MIHNRMQKVKASLLICTISPANHHSTIAPSITLSHPQGLSWGLHLWRGTRMVKIHGTCSVSEIIR
jgi:hypothetical protein